MVRLLIVNVIGHCFDSILVHRERAIHALPFEKSTWRDLVRHQVR